MSERYCPYCGARLPARAVFCPNCGANVAEKQAVPPEKTSCNRLYHLPQNLHLLR